MLSKYAKRLLKDAADEIVLYPKAFHPTKITLVKKSKGVPYKIIGGIAAKVLEASGLDVWLLLKSLPKNQYSDVVTDLATMLLFGRGNVYSQDTYLFYPEYWPIGVNKDPVKRIELFLKTDGRD